MTSGNGMIEGAMGTNLDTPHDDELRCDTCKHEWEVIVRIGEEKHQLCRSCSMKMIGEWIIDYGATCEKLQDNHFRINQAIGAPQFGSGELWGRFVKETH